MELSPLFIEKIKKLEGPIFILGASGFIGANLFDAIFKVRQDCYALTHQYSQAWRLKLLEVPFENVVHCDITSASSVKLIFEKYQPKSVFNLAAYGAYSKQSDKHLTYETNVLGTLHVLENCKDVSSYIHAGSSSEYGLNSAAPDESDVLFPNSHYAVSKVSATYLIEYYARFHGVNAMNLRMYSVYGAWEEPDRLIPRLIEEIRKGKFPPLVSPDVSRDFLYIDDAVEAFIDAALNVNKETIGKSFNIATGRKTTIRELAEEARAEFKIEASPEWGSMPDRAWDLKDWFGNPNNANKFLRWKSKTELRAGLRKTYDWQEKIIYEESIIPAFARPGTNPIISVVIACYKDAQAIPVMYERLVKMFYELKTRYEIIFVNDCSPDHTEDVLEKICALDSHVVAITHSRNFGSQAAFQSGMEISTGEAVVLMDGDLQDPPEMIPKFYERWLEGYEVVYGRRIKREMNPYLDLIYKSFYRLFKRMSYVDIPVDAGDFSMMDRKVVNELTSLPETEQFLRGLRAWVGFKQTGVDYIRPERMFGVSTNNWRKNFWWAKKAIFSFSFLPLEMMTYLGFILTGISFLGLILQVIVRFMYPDIPHGITTIIVLVLFFGGIQVLAISFIGEYISKIFEETKKRPKFIRKKIRKSGKVYSTAESMQELLNKSV